MTSTSGRTGAYHYRDMDMLTQEDLNKIGDVVDQRIEAKVGAIIDSKVGPMIDSRLEAQTEMILSVVKKGFDGVDERFDSMELKFDAKLAAQKHELMDHTDRTVAKAAGGLRSELRELKLIV
jgi:hypothetical protein